MKSTTAMLYALNHLRDETIQNCKMACDQISNLEERVKSIADREDVLKSVTGHLDNAHLNDLLLLNFGGEHLDIERSLLLLHSERTGLKTLLSGRFDHLLPKDKNGRIFFDFDKRFAEPMFNRCRDLAMWNGDDSTKPTIATVEDKRFTAEEKMVRDYFHMRSPCQNSKRELGVTKQSSVLSNLETFDEQLLFNMVPQESQFSSATLLYRGSRDGFKAKDFHDKCDGKPNTVTIIRDTKDNVFGGYASVPWASPNVCTDVADPSAFLFTLAVESKVNVVQHKPLSGTTPSLRHNSGYMCIFGVDGLSKHDLTILHNCHVRCSMGMLGRSFDASGSVITRWTAADRSTGKYAVQQIEVFQLNSCENNKATDLSFSLSVSGNSSYAVAGKRKRATTTTDDDEQTLSHFTETVKEQDVKLRSEAEAFIAELHFVAKLCGVTLPPRSEPVVAITTDGENDSDEVDQFASALAYIRELNAVLQSTDTTVTPVVADTVTINAGGRLVTTTKATLKQAPEGSILANMTSDVWGHSLDRDGNIYQSVNSKLFVTIINHLRLKQLLSGTSIQVVPPIVVYEEQKTALDNLLAFYMLTDDLPVKTIAH